MNRKKLIILISICLFGLAVLSPHTKGQKDESAATLKETLDWLKLRLPGFSEHRDHKPKDFLVGEMDSVERIEPLNFNSCNLSWRRKLEQTGPGVIHGGFIQTWDISVSLSDIDPIAIEVESHGNELFGVVMKTYGDKQSIKIIERTQYKNGSVDNPTDTSEKEIAFGWGTKELSNRIARGFKHAVTLCGGKVEPF